MHQLRRRVRAAVSEDSNVACRLATASFHSSVRATCLPGARARSCVRSGREATAFNSADISLKLPRRMASSASSPCSASSSMAVCWTFGSAARGAMGTDSRYSLRPFPGRRCAPRPAGFRFGEAERHPTSRLLRPCMPVWAASICPSRASRMPTRTRATGSWLPAPPMLLAFAHSAACANDLSASAFFPSARSAVARNAIVSAKIGLGSVWPRMFASVYSIASRACSGRPTANAIRAKGWRSPTLRFVS